MLCPRLVVFGASGRKGAHTVLIDDASTGPERKLAAINIYISTCNGSYSVVSFTGLPSQILRWGRVEN